MSDTLLHLKSLELKRPRWDLVCVCWGESKLVCLREREKEEDINQSSFQPFSYLSQPHTLKHQKQIHCQREREREGERVSYRAMETWGGRVREDGVRESERALSIFSACARRGGRLLFESTLGADDFVLQHTGCRSKDARAKAYREYTPYKLYGMWAVKWVVTVKINGCLKGWWEEEHDWSGNHPQELQNLSPSTPHMEKNSLRVL